MKILFVSPRFWKYTESLPGVRLEGAELLESTAYAPGLGLPTLAAVTPSEHQWHYVDQNLEDVDFEAEVDVVAMSVFTPQASSAYELCARFRERGTKVVVGGIHPSLNPDEARRFADVVCVGEGEALWPRILEELERGEAQPIYRQPRGLDLGSLPPPDRSMIYALTSRLGVRADYLELSRGCPSGCRFCVVPKVTGEPLRLKPVEAILAEVEALRYPMCFITDDILFTSGHPDHRAHLEAALAAIESVPGRPGFLFASIPSELGDPPLLERMRRAGFCVAYLTFGLDPFSNTALRGEPEALRRQMIEAVDRLHALDYLVYGAFYLGLDDHREGLGDNVRRFCEEAQVDVVQLCLHTPWPGTEAWSRALRDERVLHRRWSRYNTAHVVCRPRRLSVEELEQTFLELWRTSSRRYHLFSSMLGEGPLTRSRFLEADRRWELA